MRPASAIPRIPDDTIALVWELARLMPDRQIAACSIAPASRPGTAMPGRKGACAAPAIATVRAVFRDGEWEERGEITAEAAAPN